MDWFLIQAQNASPLFAVGCIIGIGVLWRQHIRDQQTIAIIGKASSDALLAAGISIEKGSATIALAMTKLAAKVVTDRPRRRRRR